MSLWLVCLLAVGSLLASCKDDEKKNVLKPLSTHLLGKWETVSSFKLEDGKWIEEALEKGEGQTLTLREDGMTLISRTDGDRQTALLTSEWSVNDSTNELKLQTTTFSLLSLEADRFEMGMRGKALDSETGEPVEGEFKWLLVRMDESQKTFAERLVGKWIYRGTFEKVNGEWMPCSFAIPDEAWNEYREDGTLASHVRIGNDVNDFDLRWSINNESGELRHFKGEQSMSSNLSFEDDRSYSILYTENRNHTTGEVKTGEFKDVYVRQ